MREIFKTWRPQGKSLVMLQQVNAITEEYRAQGLRLTLRQLFYQLVSRDIIPNTEKSYRGVISLMNRARCGGLVDWELIEDRVRQPVIWAQWNSVDELLDESLRQYRLPRLNGQPTYCELWVEKDALAGVLRPIAAKYHVTLMVNRGYSSASAMKEAADRIRECCVEYGSENAIVFYLGDHDPSGEDMVRDIAERLNLFCNNGFMVDDEDGIEDEHDAEERRPFLDVTVSKLALDMGQIRKYKPPPNPAKLTDSRAKDYIAKHGASSWEVDALPPNVLRNIIVDALSETIDQDLVDEIVAREESDKKKLQAALKKMKKESR